MALEGAPRGKNHNLHVSHSTLSLGQSSLALTRTEAWHAELEKLLLIVYDAGDEIIPESEAS